MLEFEMTFQVFLAILSDILSPLICACIFWYGKKYWNNKEDSQRKYIALGVGVQALLRDRLLQGCKYYQKQGFSTYNARANMTMMHEAYVNLGGNSVEVYEYKKFMDLPHKPDDEYGQ